MAIKKYIRPKLNILLIAILIGTQAACLHNRKNLLNEPKVSTPEVLKNDINISYIPIQDHTPPYILYQKTTRYKYGQPLAQNSFKRDLALDANMRNVEFFAIVEKNNKFSRRIEAQKTLETILSAKKTSWSPSKSKLTLLVPYLAEGEELIVTVSYEWMDTRWLKPIELEEVEFTKNALLTIDIPHGVTMHFQAAKNREAFLLIPKNDHIEKPVWGSNNSRTGQGIRYTFEYLNTPNSYLASYAPTKSDLLQLFVAFETTNSIESATFFDSWEKVASFIYGRTDRFDLPSTAIREFAMAQTKDNDDIKSKIATIFSFLKNNIEKRNINQDFLNLEAQPASRTFIRRTGSNYDIAILGKALFSSINIAAELIAVANKKENPQVSDFFTPALFNQVLLAVYTTEQTYFFDPAQEFEHFHQLSPYLQGQNALVLKDNKGYLFNLPFDDATKHGQTLYYDLNLSEEGTINGSFNLRFDGLDAFYAHKKLPQNKQAWNPQILEKALLAEQNAIFKWREVYADESSASNLSIQGTVANLALPINSDHRMQFLLSSLLLPIKKVLTNKALLSYSQVNSINIKLSVPQNFSLEDDLLSANLHLDGFYGQLLKNFKDGVLNIDCSLSVSLPLGKDLNTNELDNFLSLLEKDIVIATNKAIEPPASDEAHEELSTTKKDN